MKIEILISLNRVHNYEVMVGQRLRDTDKIQVQVHDIQAVKVTARFLYC